MARSDIAGETSNFRNADHAATARLSTRYASAVSGTRGRLRDCSVDTDARTEITSAPLTRRFAPPSPKGEGTAFLYAVESRFSTKPENTCSAKSTRPSGAETCTPAT